MTLEHIYAVTSFRVTYLNDLLEEELFQDAPTIDALEGVDSHHSIPVYAKKSLGIGHPDVLVVLSCVLGPAAVALLVATLCGYCSKKVLMPQVVEQALIAVHSKIKWNIIVRYLMQTYLTLILSLLLVADKQDFSFDDGLPGRGLLWALCFGLLTAFPLLSYAVMLSQQATLSAAAGGTVNMLKDDAVKARYGTLWLNVDPGRLSSLAHSLFFLARRYLMALVIVFASSGILQISLLWAGSFLLLMYGVMAKPMSSPAHNCLLTLNETIVYTSTCLLFLFTGYVSEAESRWIFGYVFIGAAYLCILLNITVILTVAVKWVKRHARIQKAKRWQSEWKAHLAEERARG